MFIVLLGLVICGLVLFLLIKMSMDKSKHTNSCIIPITALVVDVDVKLAEDLGKTGESLWYKPVLKIDYNGELIELKPSNYSDLRPFALGENVRLMINPANPYEFYYDDGVTRDYKSKAGEFVDIVKTQLKS